MQIGITSIARSESYILYEIESKIPNQNHGSFSVSSLAICDFKSQEKIKALLTDNSILLNASDSLKQHKLQVGSKTVNQLKLWQFGFHIPNTVVLDYSFFDNFEESGFVDLRDVYNLEIAGALGPSLAIRCSSNVEDGESETYAGVFDSYLNVPNNFAAIQASIFRSYGKFCSSGNVRGESDGPRIKLGVMIQNMVQPKLSGFLFTMDPLNPPSHWMRIEYWQGEREKSDGYSVILNNENGKRIRSGRDEIGNPFPLRAQNELYSTAMGLSANFGFPQDAEFLISAKDELFFVQSRPITAFCYSPDKVRAIEQNKLSNILKENRNLYNLEPILSSTNISELFTRATPLSYSIFKNSFAGTLEHEGGISIGRSRLGYAKLDLADQVQMFYTVGDQARINLIVDALTFRLPGTSKREYLDNFVNHYFDQVRQDPTVAIYPEDRLYQQTDDAELWDIIAGEKGPDSRTACSNFLYRIVNDHAPREYDAASSFFKENERFYRDRLSQELDSASEAKLIQEILHILGYLRTTFCPQYVVFARLAFLCTHVAERKLSSLLGPELPFPRERILNRLLRSITVPIELEEPNYPHYERLVKEKKITVGDFLNRFGHLGSLDIKQPRLGEYSFEGLYNIFGQNKQFEFDDVKSRDRKPNQKIDADIMALGLEKNTDFLAWYTYGGRFMRLRERAKHELLKVLYVLKLSLRRFAGLHRFDESMYYLEINELLELTTTNRNQLRLLALQRKAYWESCEQHRVKGVILDFQSNPFEERPSVSGGSPNNRYKFAAGKSIVFGHAEGVCLTAESNDEFINKLADYRRNNVKNIIGVFKGVELSYFNLSELAGFTTENGGYLSHAATIAREYRLPYITDIRVEEFQDGDYIILDTENEQVIFRDSPRSGMIRDFD